PWEPDAEETVAIRSANHLKVRFIQQSPNGVHFTETACHYLRGLPASERFSLTLPSLLRSRGWVPPPGLGTTTPGLSGLLSAIIPFPNRLAKVPPF
ncbi:hypothetical protein, partial [Pantoea agglomerans]